MPCVRGSVEEKVKGSRVVDQRTHLDFSVAPEKGLGVAAITESGNRASASGNISIDQHNYMYSTPSQARTGWDSLAGNSYGLSNRHPYMYYILYMIRAVVQEAMRLCVA